MSANAALVLALTIIVAWKAAVFGVTAYAVFWLGYSGWWFALALALSATGVTTRDGQ